MTVLQRHRRIWQGKSDEWLFERLDNELKQKVEEIHRLLAENEALRKHAVVGQSEQCAHPRDKCEYIGSNMLRCRDCGKEFS